MGAYWKVVKKSSGITIALKDRPENILERLTFYDIDSKLIEKKLSAREKRLYLAEIRKDNTYFGRTHKRANLQVDIAGLNVDQAACKLREVVVRIAAKANRPTS